MTRHVYVLVAAVVPAILAAAPATAQSRFRSYAGASIGSFSVSADQVDGRSLAGGLFGGLSLAKHVDLDVEFVFPGGHVYAMVRRPRRVVRRAGGVG